MQTTYNRWRKRNDNLVSTLILTQCDPPLKYPGYGPGLNTIIYDTTSGEACIQTGKGCLEGQSGSPLPMGLHY